MIAVRRLRVDPLPERSELLSIGERARYLFWLRIAFAAAPVAFAIAEPNRLGAGVGLGIVAAASACYLLLATVPQLLEGRGRTVVDPIVRGLPLLDGLFLGTAVAVTGGAMSPLRYLAFAHVMAVTLLLSYRSGLKIALWHTMLYLLVASSEPSGLVGDSRAIPSGTVTGTVVGLWATTLGAATFAALSERQLRRQKVDLERLSAMLGRMQVADDAGDIARILLDELCETFGFRRGAVFAAAEGDLEIVAAVRVPPSDASLIGMEPLAYRARSQREVLAVHTIDPETDPELASLFPDARNVLVVPLLVERGRSIGFAVLELGGHDRTIRRSDIAMVEQFASHGSLALNNAWLADERLARLRQIEELQGRLESVNAELEATVDERTRELRAAIAHLEDVDRQRRRLLEHVVKAGEEERRRIAADIHDDPVQKLVALKMRLELLAKANPHLEDAVAAKDVVLVAIRSLRHLLFDLRPPVLDEQGLGPALRSFLEHSDATFRWTVEDEIEREIPGQTRVILYRIAQEALTNTRKHAQAEQVRVRLSESQGGVAMEIVDDGVGFEPMQAVVAAPGHMGLAAIRERAEMAGGRCELHSLPGQGTTLDVWLPLPDSPAASTEDPEILTEPVGA
jgi:signal transduction histidine kinase